MSDNKKKDINEHLVLVVAIALVMLLSIGGLALLNAPAQADGKKTDIMAELLEFKDNTLANISEAAHDIKFKPIDLSNVDIMKSIKETPEKIGHFASNFIGGVGQEIVSFENFAQEMSAQTASIFQPKIQAEIQSDIPKDPFVDIAAIEGEAISLNAIITSAGEKEPMEYADIHEAELGFPIEQENLTTEGVLVPKQKTVISSSRDGKIAKIYVDNGDTFKKGDTLLEYDCKDARSEVAIAKLDKDFKKKQLNTTMRLLKLDLISDVEQAKVETESEQAKQKEHMVRTKLDHCYITATYNGRVVRRLANPNEYTRTDRVLIEVASTDTMDVEFLIPSKWLRWVNIDAPFSLTLNETGKTYEGIISRIYGEVDPVSQSIQIRGSLNGYDTPLLPGMSGNIGINAHDVRSAGVMGYLEPAKE